MTIVALPDTATDSGRAGLRLRSSRGQPIDWDAVEHDYRAGRLSLRQMSLKHGCSHSSIANHAGRKGWTRNPFVPTRSNDE